MMCIKGYACLWAFVCLFTFSHATIVKPRAARSVDLSSTNTLIQDLRLTKDVLPFSYNLTLHPFLEDNKFSGNIKINLKWNKDAKKIYLHAHTDLNINETNILINCVQQQEVGDVSVRRVDRLPKKSTLILFLNNTIKKGATCEIVLNFDGHLWENTDGIFKKTYVNPMTNLTEYYVATNMKPNNARRLFPCFDEPEVKATFTFTVSRPETHVALFNSVLESSHKLENGLILDRFEPTTSMSTFSFGFVIANLQKLHEHKECVGNFSQINVWSTPVSVEAIEPLKCKLLQIYEQIATYFNASLPWTKIDVVAIPEFALVRPVDNMGLIIFRESELLKNTTSNIAFEFITQWLGAWLTPEWWNDMLITKALASFLSAQNSFVFDEGHEFSGKYPMTILYSVYYEFSKRYPNSRITGMKHETSSYKAELVVRMLNFTLGGAVFQKGVQNFVVAQQSACFTSNEIWKAVSAAAVEAGTLNESYNLTDIVSSWVQLDRLPVVNVTRDYENNKASVEQKLYLRERPHDVPDREKMLWWIPLVIVSQKDMNFGNTTPYAWMEKQRSISIENLPNKEQFIIVNPEEIGPFVVNYDLQNWRMLSEFLEKGDFEKIPINTRAKLLHDAWNLAYAGDLEFGVAFNMTLFMQRERNHVVWNPIFTFIDHVGRHIDNSHVHTQFEIYVKYLLSPLYEELGDYAADEASWKTNLRSLAKTFLCRCGYQPCIDEAQQAYKTWMNNVNNGTQIGIPKDFLCPVFKWGTFEEWEFGLQCVINYPESAVKSERTFLLKMLAKCPIENTTITHLLNITFLQEENTTFSDNDVILILRALTEGSNGYQTLFEFLEENWTLLRERLSGKRNVWDTLIAEACGHFTTQAGYDRVKSLYESKSGEFGSADHLKARSLKNIKEEVKWTNENIPAIEKWLKNFLDKKQI